MRNIQDILYFRGDISPFLVHLTKDSDELSAKEVLEKILDDRELIAGQDRISDAQYGGFTREQDGFDDEKVRTYFSAICFTETPLNETHCLLEIARRNINLSQYGLVFLKENLKKKGVCPVLYLNNELGNQDEVVRALFSLIKTHPEPAKLLIPLISVFGRKLCHPGATTAPEGTIDFTWEREWRLPPIMGNLKIVDEDIFIGLCPHDQIKYFEDKYQPLKFIDPLRNMKWYATKLIESRQRLDLKYSVV